MTDLLAVVENPSGDMDRADVAEQHVIEGLRRMGRELMRCWAQEQSRKKAEQLRCSKPGLCKHSKKNCIGIAVSEK
jgi:hypothetical protein